MICTTLTRIPSIFFVCGPKWDCYFNINRFTAKSSAKKKVLYPTQVNMEVLKSDFEVNLPLLKEALCEADFIAIDTEFTGKIGYSPTKTISRSI